LKNNLDNKLKNWLWVFLWAGVIFFFSSQPDLKSGLPNQWDFILRKLAHIAEYAVLTLFLIRALKEHRLNRRQLLFLAMILALLYAASDEYHQTFVLGRQGVVRDILIDGAGVFLTCLFTKFRYSFNTRL